MAFSIDENLLMQIRKGTTGEFIIEDLPLSFVGFTMRLIIKKDAYTPDAKCFVNITTTITRAEKYDGGTIVTDELGNIEYMGAATIKIPVSESDKLVVPKDEEYASYVWGVLVEDGTGDLAVNIIPEKFEEMPECRVYPEIAGNN